MITLLPHVSSGAPGDPAGSAIVFWGMAVLVGVALLLGASARLVARNQRAVVLRSDRVARLGGPGIAFRIPVVEQLKVVSLDPVEMPLVVAVRTRERVAVRIMATAVARVTSPELSTSVPDPLGATAEAVERVLQQTAAQRHLDDLIVRSDWLGSRLRGEVNLEAAAWGTEVTWIRLDSIDTDLTPSSLRRIRAGSVGPAKPARRFALGR